MRFAWTFIGLSLFALTAPARAANDATESRGVTALRDRGGVIVSFDNLFGWTRETRGRSRDSFGLGPGLFGPRLGVHGVTRGGVTIGGVTSILLLGERGELGSGVLLVGPRIGWMAMSSRGVGFWPRAGVTALLGDFDDPVVYVSLELPAVISLTRHAALTFGPTFDHPVSDERSAISMLGITAGLLGAF